MTSLDAVIQSIKSLILDSIEVPEISVFTAQSEANRNYPLIEIFDTSTAEDEVLRGVYKSTIDVNLLTVLNESGLENQGTTQAEHLELASNIYCLLGDTQTIDGIRSSIDYLNSQEKLKVFDLRLISYNNTQEDQKGMTSYNLEVVHCFKN